MSDGNTPARNISRSRRLVMDIRTPRPQNYVNSTTSHHHQHGPDLTISTAKPEKKPANEEPKVQPQQAVARAANHPVRPAPLHVNESMEVHKGQGADNMNQEPQVPSADSKTSKKKSKKQKKSKEAGSKRPVLIVAIALIVFGVLTGSTVYSYLQLQNKEPSQHAAHESTNDQSQEEQANEAAQVDEIINELDEVIDLTEDAANLPDEGLDEESLGL